MKRFDLIINQMAELFSTSKQAISYHITKVHDELNFSVYPEEKGRVEAIVLEEMQNALEMNVPLVADSGFGNNWLEAH